MSREVVRGDRARQTEYVSTQLLPHVALLLRLLSRDIESDVTRTEAGVLRSLLEGPRRITELAQVEGLAQPTTTLVVTRLENRGWVRRQRQFDDQRVVLVWLTEDGIEAFESYRELAFAALRAHLDAMPDDQLKALAAATDALGELITTLHPAAAQAAGAG